MIWNNRHYIRFASSRWHCYSHPYDGRTPVDQGCDHATPRAAMNHVDILDEALGVPVYDLPDGRRGVSSPAARGSGVTTGARNPRVRSERDSSPQPPAARLSLDPFHAGDER